METPISAHVYEFSAEVLKHSNTKNNPEMVKALTGLLNVAVRLNELELKANLLKKPIE